MGRLLALLRALLARLRGQQPPSGGATPPTGGGGTTTPTGGGTTPPTNSGVTPAPTGGEDDTPTSGDDTSTGGTGDDTSTGDGGETPTDGGGETPTDDGGETPTDDGGETPTDDGGETPTDDGGETPTDDGGETPTDDDATDGDAVVVGGGSDPDEGDTDPPGGPFVRQEAGALGSDTETWDPIMLAFANAIKTMQSRPDTDPTSWTYQAGIHGSNNSAQRAFNTCQHQTWFFLPWHRLYLHRFEAIVRAAVVDDGGPADWALPYWDYEHNAALPWVMRQQTMPDGSDNPLFTPLRARGINDGDPLNRFTVDSSQAMGLTRFGPITPGSPAPTFGGANTSPSHFGSFNLSGQLELQPHNGVHVDVGRGGGLMIDPNTAPLDPIFWLHHCNIDRLWEVWNRNGNDTTDSASFAAQTFEFFGADGAVESIACANALDIEGQLNYSYTGLPEATGPSLDTGFEQGGPDMPAEMIGGSDGPTLLGGDRTRVEMAMDTARGPALDTGSFGDEPQRMYLTIENVTADAPPSTSYLVIVDMGTPDDPTDDFTVGIAAFFGVEKASSVDGDDQPHGMNFTYDITEVVARLQARGLWDESQLRVAFEPTVDLGDEEATPITVGNIRVFAE